MSQAYASSVLVCDWMCHLVAMGSCQARQERDLESQRVHTFQDVAYPEFIQLGGPGRAGDETKAARVPGLSMLANASPPFSLVRLTFVAHHAATSTADRSVTPCRHPDRKCLTPKPRLQKAFIAQPADEALHEAVLHRLARRDVVPLDLSLLLPGQDGVRGQLGAVVGDDHAGIAAALGDLVELAADPLAGERVVDDGCQALPAEVVDDAQDAEAPAVGQGVGDEVEAPALVGILRDRHRRSGAESSLAATALAHRQPLLAVEPVELLPVHRRHPPASAEGAAGGSRSGAALPPVPAAACAGRHRPVGVER